MSSLWVGGSTEWGTWGAYRYVYGVCPHMATAECCFHVALRAFSSAFALISVCCYFEHPDICHFRAVNLIILFMILCDTNVAAANIETSSRTAEATAVVVPCSWVNSGCVYSCIGHKYSYIGATSNGGPHHTRPPTYACLTTCVGLSFLDICQIEKNFRLFVESVTENLYANPPPSRHPDEPGASPIGHGRLGGQYSHSCDSGGAPRIAWPGWLSCGHSCFCLWGRRNEGAAGGVTLYPESSLPEDPESSGYSKKKFNRSSRESCT